MSFLNFPQIYAFHTEDLNTHKHKPIHAETYIHTYSHAYTQIHKHVKEGIFSETRT